MKKRFTEAQIVSFPREADAGVASAEIELNPRSLVKVAPVEGR
jgi:hypothetical protein